MKVQIFGKKLRSPWWWRNLFPRDVIAILPVFKLFTPHFLWLNHVNIFANHLIFPPYFLLAKPLNPIFHPQNPSFHGFLMGLYTSICLFVMAKTYRKTMEKIHISHIFPAAPAPLWPRSFAAFLETAPPWHGGSARPHGRSLRDPGAPPFEKWRGRPWEKWWV